jgi:hypothetical protein
VDVEPYTENKEALVKYERLEREMKLLTIEEMRPTDEFYGDERMAYVKEKEDLQLKAINMKEIVESLPVLTEEVKASTNKHPPIHP